MNLFPPGEAVIFIINPFMKIFHKFSLPDAEDESSSNIDSDKDEDLKISDLENDENELSEEEKNSDGQSSPSIMILSDEEYAEEGALQDVSNDEYAEEEGKLREKI
nr:BPK_HP1_G0043780.mRNA.1.CDS.1 [Saccharomyces cerevisiae]